ncbi:IS30 family transposase [Mycoplasma sp. P36-A1]|uniref:IS30 family transposase n=1 Tax=Mycoplasma sp. P36-A1 TaxID=3252900 RepID=UPI003C2E321E
METNKGKHLTLVEREYIESKLKELATKTSIAKDLGKSKSTISKEIKNHRYLYIKSYSRDRSLVFDCIHMQECKVNKCNNTCSDYSMIPCKHRDKIIGVCNGCVDILSCRYTRYRYDAKRAQNEYEYSLVDSRIGVNLTTSQASIIGSIIKPLINNGHSPYAIIKSNDNLNICEKTLYNYISNGVFSKDGLIDLDLRCKVSRKVKKIKSKPRNNRAYLTNRKFNDFEKYLLEHASSSVVEMDTVYNNISTGPFIQTFYIRKFKIMIGVYQNEKSMEAMVNGLKYLKSLLGDDLYKNIFQVILTDRGSEFYATDKIEELGSKLFYCDPMASYQKANVERGHVTLRYILPKEKDLNNLGLKSQEDLDLIFSHINSYPVETCNGKSPINYMKYFIDNTNEILQLLKISEIEPSSIILKPKLIKK